MTDLNRATLSTSRMMDFFSEKELVTQTGHQVEEWPLVILKELVDNALDACEEAGAGFPQITVGVDERGITVWDNGPGIPAETVRGVLDFSIRTSSREAYVAPDRGAQGNALMTLVAMPFVIDGHVGNFRIVACGVKHDITIRVDQLRQEPVVSHTETPLDHGTNGTMVTVSWPDSPGSILPDSKANFLQVAAGYGMLNPHLHLVVDWFGERSVWHPTDIEWKKWTPRNPTSPHWYKPDQFRRLIAAYLSDGSRSEFTVRELVSEFRGLSGTAKQRVVLEQTGLARQPLAALMNGDGGLDHDRTEVLLQAMQQESKPVRPALLGVIGKAHISTRLVDLGCHPDSVSYSKQADYDEGVPWVIETAFGYRPDADDEGVIVAGVNWSPSITNPFRKLSEYGISLDAVLEHQRVRLDEPVVVVVHLAIAHVQYTDRGKSAVVVS